MGPDRSAPRGPADGDASRRGPRAASCARLAIELDAARLGDDLRAVGSEVVPAAFGPALEAGWHELVLRAPDGDARLFAGSIDPDAYAATPALDRAPYLREWLARLECPVLSARIWSLPPSGLARERAPRPTEGGRVELRVVIRSDPDVRIRVGRSHARVAPGQVWWLDPREPVHVEGRDHAQLVVDCLASEWLHHALAEAAPAADPDGGAPSVPFSPDAIEQRVRVALGDADLAAQLACARDLDELVMRLGLAPERAAELARARPRGLDVPLDEWPAGDGWVPAEVEWVDGEPSFRLAWLAPDALAAPFFEDALRAARRAPLSRHVVPRVSLAAVERFVAARPPLPLVGTIAHVSRCGSTLVARMLGAASSLVVVSEPPPLDTVLRAGPADVPPALRLRAIRATVATLGRRRTGRETGLVVKLDAWHLASMERLREAFPDAPTVLLFRDPADVLASQMRVPGLQMVAGVLGPPFDAIPASSPALEHRARVVGLLFELAARLEQVLLVGYVELPEGVATRVAPHFGVALSPDERAAMGVVSREDAKSPSRAFVPVAPSSSDDALAAAAERWAGAPYRALVAKRNTQLSGRSSAPSIQSDP